MREKLKVLKNQKVLIVIGILFICVVGIFVAVGQKNNDKSGGTSSKKELLKKYSDSPWKYMMDDEYRETFDLTNSENEKLMCLYKAAIDYAMESTRYDGRESSLGYFAGIHKAVMRLQKLDDYQEDIKLVTYEGEKCYKVGSDVVADIGHAMWGMDIPKWDAKCQQMNIVEYDLEKDVYYFEKEEPVDYYLAELYEEMDDVVESTTGDEYITSVVGTMTLSKEYVYSYSINRIKLDVDVVDNNSFLVTINDVAEASAYREPSLLEYNSDSTVSKMDIIANSTFAMECIVVPYAYYREECETDKEAAWRSIYYVINKLVEYEQMYAMTYGVSNYSNLSSILGERELSDIFRDDIGSDDTESYDEINESEYIDVNAILQSKMIEHIYSLYGVEKEYDGKTDKHYVKVTDVFINDLMDIYTGDSSAKAKKMPEDLKKLFTYDESTGYYTIELKSEEYKEIYMDIEYEIVPYSGIDFFSVYVIKRDEQSDVSNIINAFVGYAETNNMHFAIQYVYY